MVKTHEIDLNTSAFNQLERDSYIILNTKDMQIEINDYILFKQTEESNGKTQYTELHRLAQVRGIIEHQGLKDGYVLLVINKL